VDEVFAKKILPERGITGSGGKAFPLGIFSHVGIFQGEKEFLMEGKPDFLALF